MILPSGWHALQLVSLAAFTYSASISGRTVHERRSSVPNGYTTIGPANVDSMLTMRIGLAMGNRTGLESAMSMASDPEHENYGQWLSQEDVSLYLLYTRWISLNVIHRFSTMLHQQERLSTPFGSGFHHITWTHSLLPYQETG